MSRFVRRLRDTSGQSIIEMAMVTPLLVMVVLGVVDVSYALLDQHVVTRLTREGSNLISRDTSLGDAATALQSMSTAPVDFSTKSTVIFSVLWNVPSTTASNYGQTVLFARYQYGAGTGTSVISTAGSGSFGGAPDYQANNPDNDTSLQVHTLPAGLTLGPGDLVYVTEIYTTHQLITPLDQFGIHVPTSLYSVAYF
jgi:TadE-like protein